MAGSPGVRRVLGNLGLLIASVAVVLLMAEAGFRLFRPVQYLKPPSSVPLEERRETLYRRSRVPGLSYEMIPGRNGTFEGMQVRTNSFGMRGGEPAPDATPGLFRILVLGDSFTFGFGVAEEEAYPAVLMKILNDRLPPTGGRYEVLNLGVLGYSTRDEAIRLAHVSPSLHPKGVILGYVLNDPEIDPRPSLHKVFDRPSWWRRSHVLRLLHLAGNTLEVWRFGGGDYLRYLHAPGREKWQSVVDGFAAVRDLAARGDFRVMVVIFPMIPERDWGGYSYTDLHRRVGEAAAACGFEVVDLLEPFSKQSPAQLRVSTGDGHPTALGHRLAAEAIAARWDPAAPRAARSEWPSSMDIP